MVVKTSHEVKKNGVEKPGKAKSVVKKPVAESSESESELSSKRKHLDDFSEPEEEEEEEEEEEVLKVHVKSNGFKAKEAQNPEHGKLTTLTSDLKGQEAQEAGDFKNFDLSKDIIAKLHGKGIKYLYPIQIATLKHIRAGDDVIAQASE